MQANTRDYLSDISKNAGFILELYDEETNQSVLKYKSKDGLERYISSSTDPEGGGGSSAIPVIEVSGDTPTLELAPNTFYKFTGIITALTVTLGTPEDGIVNIYSFSFISGQANPTISLPNDVVLSETPTINSGDYVEFSIMDNKGVCKVWEAS